MYYQNNMNWFLFIYLIGVIISYYMLRYIFRKEEDLYNPYDWDRVYANSILSLLSFVVVIIILIIWLTDKIESINFKPPKWL